MNPLDKNRSESLGAAMATILTFHYLRFVTSIAVIGYLLYELCPRSKEIYSGLASSGVVPSWTLQQMISISDSVVIYTPIWLLFAIIAIVAYTVALYYSMNYISCRIAINVAETLFMLIALLSVFTWLKSNESVIIQLVIQLNR